MVQSYHPRVALRDPTWFHGREDEIRRLFSYLDRPSPQNVSIVGQRRIGKSWLLKVVALDDQRRASYLQEPDKFTFIYWDLQSEPRLAPDVFFRKLVQLLLSHIPYTLREECEAAWDEEEPEESLLDILELLEIDEHRVVLLLDEFATVTRDTSFAESFFSHLRSIFSRPSLSCVTASYRSLGEMCHLGPDSPFFNIFSRIQLGLFDWKEAQRFIAEPLKTHEIEVEDNALQQIIRLVGPHPCFLSQLGHELLNSVEASSRLTVPDIERYEMDFYAMMFDDFQYYWQRLDEEEKSLLRNIAEGNPPARTSATLRSLEQLSLVRSSGKGPVPFSTLFQEFLQETKGVDIYFANAFSNSDLAGPSFIQLCEIVLASATHIPRKVRTHLEAAIRTMHGRPHEAMRTCGRDALDPVMFLTHQREFNSRWDGDMFTLCKLLDTQAEQGRFPKHLASHFHSVRTSGNDGSHHVDKCTPARAFLTVLETIHLAEEIYTRYAQE